MARIEVTTSEEKGEGSFGGKRRVERRSVMAAGSLNKVLQSIQKHTRSPSHNLLPCLPYLVAVCQSI